MSFNDKDAFIDELSTLWQSQALPSELDMKAALQLKTKRRNVFLLDIAQAMILLASGIYFLTVSSSGIFLIAAIALLISALMVSISAFTIHFKVIRYDDWSAMGVLAFRRMSYQASIKHLRFNQLGCFLIIGFAFFITALYVLYPSMEITLTLVAVYLALIPALAILMAVLQKRIKRYESQLTSLMQTIAEFTD